MITTVTPIEPAVKTFQLTDDGGNPAGTLSVTNANIGGVQKERVELLDSEGVSKGSIIFETEADIKTVFGGVATGL